VPGKLAWRDVTHPPKGPGARRFVSLSFRAERPEPLVLREAPGHAAEESLFDLTRATISGSVLAYTPPLHRQNPQEATWIKRKCF
jgi:hypothetical protein